MNAEPSLYVYSVLMEKNRVDLGSTASTRWGAAAASGRHRSMVRAFLLARGRKSSEARAVRRRSRAAFFAVHLDP